MRQERERIEKRRGDICYSCILRGNLRRDVIYLTIHRFLTKRSKKGLDFYRQDEYNTLSTQIKGVLNSRRYGQSATGTM